jgi:RNA polymerase sigma-70 factor (ECF subfamily)
MIDIDERKNCRFGDPEFISALKRSDACAWEMFYTQIYGELYGFLRKKLSHRHEDVIEDCIQEAFSRAYAGIQSFEGKSGIKTWVMSIARYVALDEVRSVERKRETFQEPMSVKTIEAFCHRGRGQDPEKSASRRELRKKLSAAIQEELSPKLSRVLLLAMEDGLTEDETAKALNMKRGTASSYMAQAKQQLRRCSHRFKEFL